MRDQGTIVPNKIFVRREDGGRRFVYVGDYYGAVQIFNFYR